MRPNPEQQAYTTALGFTYLARQVMYKGEYRAMRRAHAWLLPHQCPESRIRTQPRKVRIDSQPARSYQSRQSQ